MTLLPALVCAIISAACFGAGIATVPLIVGQMVGAIPAAASSSLSPASSPSTTTTTTNSPAPPVSIGTISGNGSPNFEALTGSPSSSSGSSISIRLDPMQRRNLPDIVSGWNTHLHHIIPQSWIAALPTSPFMGVVVVLCGVLILTVIGATAKYLHTLLAMTVAIRTVANIRKEAFYRVIHFPLKTIVTEGTMDSVSRIIRDTNQMGRGFTAITSKTVAELFKAAAALIVALLLDWQLTLIAIVCVPILAGTVQYFSRQIKKASQRSLGQTARLLAAIAQSMQGIRVVKVHTAERLEVGRFGQANKRLLTEELSLRKAKALASPVVDLITMIGIVIIGVVAAWYMLHGSGDPATAMGVLIALAAAGASVRPLTQLSTDIHESAAGADRIAQLLATGVEKSRGETKPRLPAHHQTIEFRDVTFTYPQAAHPALKHINLTVNYGEVVAFVGPNGCGKTTLLSLVPRLFEPTHGKVLIDATDIAAASLKSVRRQIAVVTQDTVIFNDTIASNIAYGSEVSDPAMIRQAAVAARADEFIRARPEGYETVVGEQGVTLSGGQKQRLAIARAILRNPRILILDEATSMIDADSEAQINTVLEQFCRNRTSLVIAHRLSTVIDADRIVVMSQGEILDIGKHADLLARCELYQQLCRTQLG